MSEASRAGLLARKMTNTKQPAQENRLIFPHYGKGVIQSSTVLLLLCGAWLLCRQLFTKSKACMLSCVQVSNTHVRRSPTLMCAGLQHSCAQVSNTHVRRSPTLMCAGLQHSCAQVSNTHVRSASRVPKSAELAINTLPVFCPPLFV